jgi:hypothetical protein
LAFSANAQRHIIEQIKSELSCGLRERNGNLAHRTAESFKGGKFRLLEVEPHTLTSSAMGKTQRAVSDLFSQSIAEAVASGPRSPCGL